VLDHGVIKTEAGTPVAERLRLLGNELERVVRRHRPEQCAVESLFFKGGGARSVILSAQCRGVIMYVMARKNVPVVEVTPATIKLATTGSGRASKQQMNFMVRRLLRLDDRVPEHAADALAAAWCLARRLPRAVAAR
jgi:crossover junction endodeoxyribonuclease RuvC